jgi:hypothetical protein
MNSYFNKNNSQTNYQIGYGIDIGTNSNYNLYSKQAQTETQNQIKKTPNNSFENLIYTEISQCEYQVLSKNEISNRYGIITNAIANMILGPNFIVTIQNKWNITKPYYNEINNFIESTKRIGQIENKCYLGIFLSKLPIPSDAQFTFDRENLSQVNRFISVCSDIHYQITNELQKILYNYGIYYFEPDGSAIMLN